MASSLPPVTPAGGGSSSFGYPGSRKARGSGKPGFSQEDSIEIQEEKDKKRSLFSLLNSFIKKVFAFLWLLCKLIRHPVLTVSQIKNKPKPINEEKKLLEKLLTKAKKRAKKKSVSEEKLLKSLKESPKELYEIKESKAVSAKMLVAMDEVFYENFYRNMKTFGELSPEAENLTKNPIPPSILLKDAAEDMLVTTIMAQSEYTKNKILDHLPKKTMDYLSENYPQLQILNRV